MDSYERACKKREQAENECLASLLESVTEAGENLFVTDKWGNPLSREQVIKKMRDGDKE